MYVHADFTAVFPWLVHALPSQGLRRKPRRYIDRLDEAKAKLDADVAGNRERNLAEARGTSEELG